MKGDEGVQTVEERADLALLVDSLGNADLRFKEIIWSNVEQSMVSELPSAAITFEQLCTIYQSRSM